METEQLKQRFLQIFSDYVSRPGTDKLLEWLNKSDFFYAPASTRFHGNYDGGLLEHSLNVYDVFHQRIADDSEMWDIKTGACKFTEESIAITGLLHDACKINTYVKSFRNVKVDGRWTEKEVFERNELFPCGDHSDKSIILLQQFIKLEPEEILAIRAHMGAFDSAVKGGSSFVNQIFDRSRFAVHLHLADMEASYLMEDRHK